MRNFYYFVLLFSIFLFLFFIYRTKHVSFARSHTLTSFDEAMVGRSVSRLSTARSQERLIGSKKPTWSPNQSILQSVLHQQQQSMIPGFQNVGQNFASIQSSASNDQDVVLVEKFKRAGTMKTQATQTDVCLARKSMANHHLSLSPRTIHRVNI